MNRLMIRPVTLITKANPTSVFVLVRMFHTQILRKERIEIQRLSKL